MVHATPQSRRGEARVPYEEMSLEELLNVRVGVAALSLTSVLEAPGIVTLVTEDQIKNSGARDLVDVFEMIPGFKVTFDTTGMLGLSVRGVFATEGKVLVRWDGHELNEGFFGSIYVGNRYPIDQIKKIEVVRGPGSVIYGGFAGLAVVNIITKKARDLDGLVARGEIGQMTKTYGRRNVSAAYGKDFGDYQLKLGTFLGSAQRTDRDLSGFTFPASTFPEVTANNTVPSTESLAGKTGARPFFSTLDLGYKNLDISLIVDRYEGDTAYIRKVLSRPTPVQFHSYFGRIQYDWQASQSFKLTPAFSYKRQGTLNQPETDYLLGEVGASWFDGKHTEQYTESLLGAYEWNENISTIVGLESYQQKTVGVGRFLRTKPEAFSRWANNTALYTQALFEHSFANVAAGVRYNWSSLSDPSLVPRFAISKQLKNVTLKGLYSHAYRTPTMTNIQNVADPDGKLGPETYKTTEFQIGVQPELNIFFSANFFRTDIDDAIVFDSPRLGNINQDGTRVHGFELEHKYKSTLGDVDINYSYYRMRNRANLSTIVPQDTRAALGLPYHKVAMSSHFKLTENISINPSFLWQGVAYAQAYDSSSKEVVIRKFSPSFVPNIFLRYTKIFVPEITAGLGIYNITNEEYFFHQGFNARNPSYPGGSREVLLRIDYEVGI